jgi:hypothetical protein
LQKKLHVRQRKLLLNPSQKNQVMMNHARAEIAVAVEGDVVAEKVALTRLKHRVRIQQLKKMKILKNQLHIAAAAVAVLQEMVLSQVKPLKKMV